MAVYTFTEDQKVLIRQYTGRSELNRDIDPKLESVMNNLSPEAGARVVALMAQVADIEGRITVALDNLTLQRAEDVTFRGEEELEGLRRQGRAAIGRICQLFFIEPYRDYFATDAGGAGGGWGGLIPLG